MRASKLALSERQVRRRYARRCGISRDKFERMCPSGRSDIRTRTEIIEVKRAKYWKAALGQVLAYHFDDPAKADLGKRIILFGTRRENRRCVDLARAVCAHHGVEISTYHVKRARAAAGVKPLHCSGPRAAAHTRRARARGGGVQYVCLCVRSVAAALVHARAVLLVLLARDALERPACKPRLPEHRPVSA